MNSEQAQIVEDHKALRTANWLAVRDEKLWDSVVTNLISQASSLREKERYGDRSSGKRADIIADNNRTNIENRREASDKIQSTEKDAVALKDGNVDVLVADAIADAATKDIVINYQH